MTEFQGYHLDKNVKAGVLIKTTPQHFVWAFNQDRVLGHTHTFKTV